MRAPSRRSPRRWAWDSLHFRLDPPEASSGRRRLRSEPGMRGTATWSTRRRLGPETGPPAMVAASARCWRRRISRRLERAMGRSSLCLMLLVGSIPPTWPTTLSAQSPHSLSNLISLSTRPRAGGPRQPAIRIEIVAGGENFESGRRVSRESDDGRHGRRHTSGPQLARRHTSGPQLAADRASASETCVM